MGLFWNSKQKLKASELAEVLLESVFNDPNAQIKDINVPLAKQEIFNSKVDFYKQALLLLAVITEEQKNNAYALVRRSLEPILFQAPSDQEASTVVAEMKNAMTSLEEMFNSNKQMSWSMSWLADIGIQVTNPVTLASFGWFWMGQFSALQKTFEKLKPVP